MSPEVTLWKKQRRLKGMGSTSWMIRMSAMIIESSQQHSANFQPDWKRSDTTLCLKENITKQ
jgi:hypothetical protein